MPLALALGLGLFGATAWTGSGRGAVDHQVLIGFGFGGSAPGAELVIVPDPLVIPIQSPAPVGWRLDAAARQVARRAEVRFEGQSPFGQGSASGSADTLITLGHLHQPVELGRFEYTVLLFDGQGSLAAEGRAAIEIRESAGLSPRVYLIAGAIGVLLLLANYLDPKPLTRTYDQ